MFEKTFLSTYFSWRRRNKKTFGAPKKHVQDVFHEITIPQVVFLLFGGVDLGLFL